MRLQRVVPLVGQEPVEVSSPAFPFAEKSPCSVAELWSSIAGHPSCGRPWNPDGRFRWPLSERASLFPFVPKTCNLSYNSLFKKVSVGVAIVNSLCVGTGVRDSRPASTTIARKE